MRDGEKKGYDLDMERDPPHNPDFDGSYGGQYRHDLPASPPAYTPSPVYNKGSPLRDDDDTFKIPKASYGPLAGPPASNDPAIGGRDPEYHLNNGYAHDSRVLNVSHAERPLPPARPAGPSNVIVNQPPFNTVPTPVQVVIQRDTVSKDWDHGICGCCSNIPNCLCGTCCGPCLLCNNCTRVDANSLVCCLLCVFCPICVMGFVRTEARKKYHIKGNACSDCLCGLCCTACVNCQIANEADAH